MYVKYTADWPKSAFLVLHLNIAVLSRIYYGQAFLYKHTLWVKTSRERSGRRNSDFNRVGAQCEKANTEHQIIVRQSLAYTQKQPSDKWHNERTIHNVRALSVSPLQSKWGETREEGVVIHLTCSHLLIQNVPIPALACCEAPYHQKRHSNECLLYFLIF